MYKPSPLLYGMLGVIITLNLSATENPIEVTSASFEVTSDSLERSSDGVDDPVFREPVVDETAATMEGIYQQQVLQQEVQMLRGLVEELTQQVSAMKTRQADRYQDLDRRLEDFRQSLNESRVVDDSRSTEVPDLITSMGDDLSKSRDEKSLYDTALELIRNRQYDLAITQLRAVISQYPEGEYTPNAYYWLGEIYAAKPEPDYEMARKSLAQVISFFPENRKVPDAAFKLGKVYHLMGDCARAKELLTQVIEKYQGKSVAKLAESYLRDKVKCD
jgi:tol-pal system protein YbgF